MNYNRKNNENLILENSKYIVWLFIYLQITMIYFVNFVLTSFECFKNRLISKITETQRKAASGTWAATVPFQTFRPKILQGQSYFLN